jgi:hypothetical protein
VYTSRANWEKYQTVEVAARLLPFFVDVEGVTNMQADVCHYAGGNTFGSMATLIAADKPEIQARLLMLLKSQDWLNTIITTLQAGQQSGGGG